MAETKTQARTDQKKREQDATRKRSTQIQQAKIDRDRKLAELGTALTDAVHAAQTAHRSGTRRVWDEFHQTMARIRKQARKENPDG